MSGEKKENHSHVIVIVPMDYVINIYIYKFPRGTVYQTKGTDC